MAYQDSAVYLATCFFYFIDFIYTIALSVLYWEEQNTHHLIQTIPRDATLEGLITVFLFTQCSPFLNRYLFQISFRQWANRNCPKAGNCSDLGEHSITITGCSIFLSTLVNGGHAESMTYTISIYQSLEICGWAVAPQGTTI